MKVITRSTFVVGKDKDRRTIASGTEGDSAKDFEISPDRLDRLLAAGLVEEPAAPEPEPEKEQGGKGKGAE